MLDAARVCVRFCCPECGAGLRALRADAGTAIECHICGELVRVPCRPHPVECLPDDAPLIPPQAASLARSGCRLLILALATIVFEYLFLTCALLVWALYGSDRKILIAAGIIDLGLVAIRTMLKWFGYQRCEPAAREIQATGWMTTARYAVLARAIGYGGMGIPLLLGQPPDESGPAGAFVAVSQVAWMLGTVVEFIVLLVWFRLLGELGGSIAARRVTVYATTFALAVLTIAAAVCLATLLSAAARGRVNPPGPLNGVSEVPPEGWYALCGVIALATAFAVVLGWQYYRILTSIRSGLSRP